jgi:hypothetical protein
MSLKIGWTLLYQVRSWNEPSLTPNRLLSRSLVVALAAMASVLLCSAQSNAHFDNREPFSLRGDKCHFLGVEGGAYKPQAEKFTIEDEKRDDLKVYIISFNPIFRPNDNDVFLRRKGSTADISISVHGAYLPEGRYEGLIKFFSLSPFHVEFKRCTLIVKDHAPVSP